jgi:hypothetical protein
MMMAFALLALCLLVAVKEGKQQLGGGGRGDCNQRRTRRRRKTRDEMGCWVEGKAREVAAIYRLAVSL